MLKDTHKGLGLGQTVIASVVVRSCVTIDECINKDNITRGKRDRGMRCSVISVSRGRIPGGETSSRSRWDMFFNIIQPSQFRLSTSRKSANVYNFTVFATHIGAISTAIHRSNIWRKRKKMKVKARWGDFTYCLRISG